MVLSDAVTWVTEAIYSRLFIGEELTYKIAEKVSSSLHFYGSLREHSGDAVFVYGSSNGYLLARRVPMRLPKAPMAFCQRIRSVPLWLEQVRR